MARDADTIQAEIERARDALAVTVDELTTRANPKRIVEQGKQTLRAKLDEPRIRYALIGAGALVGILIIRRLFR
ncbi:DUF3618 domain-containing protein [Nakamurella sp. PAMC28650]|uniref:DUF3618 domain-containing protein n=1 Tax=Nakamurella sp. PAMC28650 TaxID=2762325 RepID=UPI00164D4B15|nr:DUF3618 domain-containing protein [Nakamurella sp. PAMC28650]QNK80538.1 DUF3618 domain-containing protein [Nakamurella sp. PAMC28650]